MNKSIRKQLKKESQEILPNIKDRIKSRLSFVGKKKVQINKSFVFGGLSFAIACLILIVAMPFMLTPNGNQNGDITIVTFDINPKFTFELDSEQKVSNITPLNLDGVFIVNEVKVLILSQPIEKAVEITLNALDNQGYIDNSNTINFIATCKDINTENKLNSDISLSMTNFKPSKGTSLKFNNSYDINKQRSAEKYKVSVGFFILAEDLSIKTKQPLSKVIQKDINDIMKELYEVDIQKLEQMSTKVADCFNSIKVEYETKKELYETQLDNIEDDIEIIIKKIKKKEDITTDLVNFKTKYSDFTYIGNNTKKALEKYLDVKENAVQQQLDALEYKFKEQKRNVQNNVSNKGNANQNIDFDKDFDFDDFDDLDDMDDIDDDFDDIEDEDDDDFDDDDDDDDKKENNNKN